jgi:uncharacterized membrane protein YoaK (UPF0700 family)
MTWLAYLLAAIAGIVDVAGYIALGGIFTAHVSGDTVTAGVDLVHAQWGAALERMAAVLLFVVGFMIGGSIIKFALLKRIPQWFSIGAAVEALFLALFAGAHALFAGGSLDRVPRGAELIVLTACLSFAMGTQNALLSNVENVPVRTTFITGMVVNFSHELLDWCFARFTGSHGGEHRRKAALYAAIWSSFALGGCAGGYLVLIGGTKVFLLPCIAMVLLALYAYRRPFARVEAGS